MGELMQLTKVRVYGRLVGTFAVKFAANHAASVAVPCLRALSVSRFRCAR